jgi:geranylgeranyl diphosphate synthase, type II
LPSTSNADNLTITLSRQWLTDGVLALNDAAEPTGISHTLALWREGFDRDLERFLQTSDDAPPRLVEAMRYSVLGGGKRLRPYLVVRCCALAGGNADDAISAAAAIEFIHTFSLIHDDLPAMDNDDLRRGKPANHKAYGEAIAILAGDALLTLAFETIARHTPDAKSATAIMLALAQATGWTGMIGGQTADILGEKSDPSRELTEYIHVRKTAALIEAACRIGAITAKTDSETLEHLAGFGHHLGCAFQIADDLLDVTATSEAMGKGVGKDATLGKQTFPAAIGVEPSRIAAREQVAQAVALLEPFGSAADDLRKLALFVVERRR